MEREDFSFGNRTTEEGGGVMGGVGGGGDGNLGSKALPLASVMTRLVLIMVWRKLITNPNTYSSLIGLIWSLVSFRWKLEMPAISLMLCEFFNGFCVNPRTCDCARPNVLFVLSVTVVKREKKTPPTNTGGATPESWSRTLLHRCTSFGGREFVPFYSC